MPEVYYVSREGAIASRTPCELGDQRAVSGSGTEDESRAS